MPLIESNYKAPWWMRHGDIATIIPNVLKKESNPGYTRERIDTPDDDFIDLDWLEKEGNSKLLIISHGLEGNSYRPYIVRMAEYFFKRDWNILAWNCRSCSGEINRQPRFYHHGATDDVETVVLRALEKNYPAIAMAGFSMGGNLTLKYLGEQGAALHPSIKGAAAFSTPVDLTSSVHVMTKRRNHYYKMRFLKKLEVKVREKALAIPDRFPQVDFNTIKEFPDFDNMITAPIHGFKDADEFYVKVSSKPFLQHIAVPTLLVNALDDPFLGEDCYPYTEAKYNPSFYLETPVFGGHVGFTLSGSEHSYMEKRAEEFLGQIIY